MHCILDVNATWKTRVCVSAALQAPFHGVSSGNHQAHTRISAVTVMYKHMGCEVPKTHTSDNYLGSWSAGLLPPQSAPGLFWHQQRGLRVSLHPPVQSPFEGKESRRKSREEDRPLAPEKSEGHQRPPVAPKGGSAERGRGGTGGDRRPARAGPRSPAGCSARGGAGDLGRRPPPRSRGAARRAAPLPGRPARFAPGPVLAPRTWAGARRPVGSALPRRTHPLLEPPAGGGGGGRGRAVPQLRRLPRPQQAPREAPRPLAGHGRRQPLAPAAAPRPGRGAVRKRNWGFPSRSPRAREVCGAGAARRRRVRGPSPGERRAPAAAAAGHVHRGRAPAPGGRRGDGAAPAPAAPRRLRAEGAMGGPGRRREPDPGQRSPLPFAVHVVT